MDIIGSVPIELGVHIFSYLTYKDLINCFKVSRQWRELANCNALWKKYCLPYATEIEIRKALSRISKPRPQADFLTRYCLRARNDTPRNYLGPWCGCAKLFKYKYGRHLRNWKNGHFIFSQLVLREPEFNVVCSARSLTFCFYKANMFAIVDLTPNGSEDIQYLDIPLPQRRHFESVRVSPDYLAVSYKNMTLVHKKISGVYVYFKTLILQKEDLKIQDIKSFAQMSFVKEKQCIVTFISGQYAWLKSMSHVYIIHLETALMRKYSLEEAHVKYDNKNTVVAWSKGFVQIFTVQGLLMYQRQMRSQIRSVAFEETFALLCRTKKNTKTFIEWWDPKNCYRKVLKRVEFDTSMVVHGENVFILEVKRHCFHRVSAIHTISGITYWIHTISLDNLAVSRFSERIIFEGICGKYLFIHVPSAGNKKYYIIDMNTGVGLYSKEFGDGHPYLFNEKVVVVARRHIIWFMNYL